MADVDVHIDISGRWLLGEAVTVPADAGTILLLGLQAYVHTTVSALDGSVSALHRTKCDFELAQGAAVEMEFVFR
jgi:hypothetical protein